MKFGVHLLIVSLIAAHTTYADSLSEADKDKLLETLDSILNANESKEEKAIKYAISRLTAAAASEESASELYESSVKKIDFEGRKEKEWRDWRDKNKNRLNSPTFKRILKYHCQWAIITLQAAKANEENPDFSPYAPQALSILNNIAEEYDTLKEFRGDMQGNILNSQVGRALQVGGMQPPKWPASIFDVNAIFESLVFPQYREKGDIAGLRNAWKKRIALAMSFAETKDEKINAMTDKTKRRKITGSKSSGSSPTSAKELSDASLKDINALRWECERDCFNIGDEATASANMIAMIRSIDNTKEQSQKAQELVNLLTGQGDEEDMENTDQYASNSHSSSARQRSIDSNTEETYTEDDLTQTIKQSGTDKTSVVTPHDDSYFVQDGPVVSPQEEPKPQNIVRKPTPNVIEITPTKSPTKPSQASPKDNKQNADKTPAKKVEDDFFGD